MNQGQGSDPNTPNTAPTAPENAPTNTGDQGHSEPKTEGHVPEGSPSTENEKGGEAPKAQTETPQKFYNEKYESKEAFEIAYKEAETKLHKLSEENSKWQTTFQTFQPIIEAISKNPEWADAIEKGMLPSDYENLPEEDKMQRNILAAIDQRLKPVMDKLALVEQTGSKFEDTLEVQNYKKTLDADEATLYTKYEEQIKQKRENVKGLTLAEAQALVVPQSEKEKIRAEKEKIAKEEAKKKKRAASVGATSVKSGTGANVPKKKMSISEAYAFALGQHKNL